MAKTGNLQLVPKVTFEAPPELKPLMDLHPEINWNSVFCKAIERQARAARIAKEILEEESDPRVQAIAAALKKDVSRRYEEARRARGR